MKNIQLTDNGSKRLIASSSSQEPAGAAAHASASAAHTPCTAHYWTDGQAQPLPR